MSAPIDFTPLVRASTMLDEALMFWGRGACRQPDLTEEQRRWLRQTIGAILPGATVHVFGSRATGRARPSSDLDLLLIDPPRLSLEQRAALVDEFEAGPLPFRVDLVERDGLWPGMSRRVWSEAVPL